MFFPLELWLVSFRIETGQGHVLIRKRGLPAREHFFFAYIRRKQEFSSVNEKLLKVDYLSSTNYEPIESAKGGKHRVYYYFY